MRRVADDDPRWRQSASGYGCNAAERMDPPPRSLARRSVWLLHGQHPIRVQPNTSVVRAIDRGQWQAPLGSSRGPTIRLLAACRRARVRQGQAFGSAEEAPSLTAAARGGDANMRSGRKNACGADRTKEWNDRGRQKWRNASLTKKAPYKPYGCRRTRWAPRDQLPSLVSEDVGGQRRAVCAQL